MSSNRTFVVIEIANAEQNVAEFAQTVRVFEQT